MTDRHVVAPCEAFTIDGRIVTVSRLASGPDARARLIRQGRFSAPAVAEIARQLLTGLSAAHRLGLVHGDIRPVNVRLSPAGDATLVDLGVRPALSPVLSIHDPRPPEWYEGTAPERIGAAAPASIATDVYSLGCLLWHLLAGRPPFPHGDPLAVLAAHRSRSLPDVRDFAPDAPSELAAVIAEMTRLEPAERPTDLIELSRRLRSARPGGRSVVRRDGAASRRREGFPWPAAAAVLFALSGACLSLADREAAATFLSTRFGTMTAAPSEGVEVATPLMPLPAPDERGVLLLEQAGPYAAVDVAFRGPLVLRGRPDRPATVVITDHPLHLWADEVTLEHVNVVHRPDGGFTSGSPALLLVEAQNLTVRSCRLEAPPRPLSERRASPAGIAWRLIDRADPTAGRVTIENCVFRGVREAAFFADPPRQVAAKNLLAVGLRSVFSLRDCGRRRVEVALEGTAVRDVGAVIGIGTSGRDAAVAVRAEDCVLDVAAKGALFAAPSGPDQCRLSWTGAGTVTAGDLRAVTDGPAERVADVS
ncbi:MAG TPA: serine/threonine-protein kinase, partial [Planctomycetaceae bacterium]